MTLRQFLSKGNEQEKHNAMIHGLLHYYDKYFENKMTYTPKSYSHYTVLCRILDKPITDNWATFVLTNEEAKLVEEKGLLEMLCKTK